MIRELASDPELRPLLQDVILGNGSGPIVARTPVREPKGVRRVVFSHVGENGDEANYRTPREIAEKMKAAGYRFKSKNPPLTVKEQLRELEATGLVERAGAQQDGSVLWRRK